MKGAFTPNYDYHTANTLTQDPLDPGSPPPNNTYLYQDPYPGQALRLMRSFGLLTSLSGEAIGCTDYASLRHKYVKVFLTEEEGQRIIS